MHRTMNTNKIAKQQNMLDKRKEKSRCAARDRRSKEKDQYDELAKLLPLPENIAKQLDKASIIRLTCSFLKYKDLIGVGGYINVNNDNMIQMPGFQKNSQKKLKTPMAQAIEKNLSCHLLRALDGFIFSVADSGKILYVSDTIEDNLGLRPLDLIGTGIYGYIHRDDHKEFQELLCSSFESSHQSDFFENIEDFDAMNFQEMQRKRSQGYISLFIRMKCTLMKRGNSSVKSSGYKVIHISGQMIRFKNLDCRGEQRYALVATGQILPPPTICELKLDTKVFVSRVNMDLRIAFCEGKIRKYMSFTSKDIVGMCAYEFYHDNDNTIVQDAHKDCLDTGKCISRAYRWMNKTGGWVWMQTVGTVISRNTPKGEEKQILCVNYIVSEIEHEDEVMHAIQLRFKQLGISDDDNLDDFGIDENNGPIVPSSDHIQASEAVDKESYIKSITHYTVAMKQTSSISDAPAPPNPEIFGPNPPNFPQNFINPEMSAAEEFRCHASDKLSTALLTAELQANPLPCDLYPNSPLSTSSFEQLSPPGYPSSRSSFPTDGVFLQRSTNTFYKEDLRDNPNMFDHSQQEFPTQQRISNSEYMMSEKVQQDSLQRLSHTLASFNNMGLKSNRSSASDLAFMDASNNMNNNHPSPTQCDQNSPTYNTSYSPPYEAPSPEMGNLSPEYQMFPTQQQQQQQQQQKQQQMFVEQPKIEPGTTSMECDYTDLFPQNPYNRMESINNNINLMQNQQNYTSFQQTSRMVNSSNHLHQNMQGQPLEPDFPSPEIIDVLEPISSIEPTIQNMFFDSKCSVQFNPQGQFIQPNNTFPGPYTQATYNSEYNTNFKKSNFIQ